MKQQRAMAVGECDHRRQEEVVNEGGDTIAYRCSGCTTILCHVGDCAGTCGKRSWGLAKFVAGKRYCGDDCYSNTMKAKLKEAAERAVGVPKAKGTAA